MARKEDFDNALWSDPEFLALTPEARLVYIWSWTNPRCGMAGIYKLAVEPALFEVGLTDERFRAALVELGTARFVFFENDVLWVRTRVKHLRQKTVQIARAIRNDLQRISDDHSLKAQFVRTYGQLPWLVKEIGTETAVSLLHPSIEPADPQHPAGATGTVNGKGTGTGTGIGVVSNTRAGEIAAIHAEHFPSESLSTIEALAFKLSMRNRELSVEAIGAMLALGVPDAA